MILVDKPYVSDLLQETIQRLNIPVIKTDTAKDVLNKNRQNFISEEDAIIKLKTDDHALLYTNSENSIHWIEKNLNFSELPEKIKLFKNKALFRELIRELYPDYFFKKIAVNELDHANLNEFKFPLIIKPLTGFFSVGVRKVDNINEWRKTISDIKNEVSDFKKLYPADVLDTSNFIVEEFIEGDEFAVDMYYDKSGNVVILNILEHLFSSSKDVSDRVYISSKDIIDTYSDITEKLLSDIGSLAELKNFPAHVEFRIDSKGKIIPIEVNPLRFGGWCTTADFAGYAFGTDTYENFFLGKKPDWEKIYKNKEDILYSLIVLDNSSGIPIHDIISFDHEALKKEFDKVLEYREMDFKKFKIFGFIFTETKKENIEELYTILKSDLKKYINC